MGNGKIQNVWGYTYKDLPIKADFRIHEEAFKLMNELVLDNNAKILDIATGTDLTPSFSPRSL